VVVNVVDCSSNSVWPHSSVVIDSKESNIDYKYVLKRADNTLDGGNVESN
jgi:hypothetical protein